MQNPQDDDGWRSIPAPIFRKKLVGGGLSDKEPIMRRRAGRGWEYRAMTPAELERYVAEEAW